MKDSDFVDNKQMIGLVTAIINDDCGADDVITRLDKAINSANQAVYVLTALCASTHAFMNDAGATVPPGAAVGLRVLGVDDLENEPSVVPSRILVALMNDDKDMALTHSIVTVKRGQDWAMDVIGYAIQMLREVEYQTRPARRANLEKSERSQRKLSKRAQRRAQHDAERRTEPPTT